MSTIVKGLLATLGVVAVFVFLFAACGALISGSDTNEAPKFEDVAPAQQVDQPQPASPAQPGGEKVVLELSGEGGKTTKPFTASDGWEIRWTLQPGQFGQLMQIFLNNADGSTALHNPVPVNTTAAGPGSSYVSQGGSYTLQVNAMGNWTIKVVDLP